VLALSDLVLPASLLGVAQNSSRRPSSVLLHRRPIGMPSNNLARVFARHDRNNFELLVRTIWCCNSRASSHFIAGASSGWGD
jgi:hypothetical protein